MICTNWYCPTPKLNESQRSEKVETNFMKDGHIYHLFESLNKVVMHAVPLTCNLKSSCLGCSFIISTHLFFRRCTMVRNTRYICHFFTC